MPTQTTGAAPAVVAPNVVEPTVSGATVRPVPRPYTRPSVRGLAFTGENIDTMAAAGAVSLFTGLSPPRYEAARSERGRRGGGDKLG